MARLQQALGALAVLSATAMTCQAQAVLPKPQQMAPAATLDPQKPLPAPATPPTAQWPKTLEPGKAVPQPQIGWSKTEVDLARAQCNALLAGLDVVAVPVDPFREGDCGAPAPIQLISVGKSPQVTLSTPAIVTCEMAAAFDKWFKAEVQPAARELLKSPVVRIEVMSSYSCRNAYGRKKTRMSEHGRANALDIKSFLTERGETTDLLADWGPTDRDIKAQIAAAAEAAKSAEAKAEAIRKEAQKAAAAHEAKPSTPAETAKSLPAPPKVAAKEAATPELRGPVVEQEPGANRSAVRTWRPAPSLGLAQPSRLGGPKAQASTDAPRVTSPAATLKGRFLRRIHASGCRTFGTVLGPESNEAHRNHFHVDMAERQSGHYCE